MDSPIIFVTFLVVTSLAGAVMDVVVDGLMVVQQRRDPNSGSEDLQTFSWACLGIGGVFGSLGGGFLTDADADRWCFAAKSIVGFLIAGIACTMDKSLEKDPTELINCTLRARTKSNVQDII